jgi:diacylglycerol kinase family enzyme
MSNTDGKTNLYTHGRRVLLIGNPVAGGCGLRKIEKAADLIARRGCKVDILPVALEEDPAAFRQRVLAALSANTVAGAHGPLVVAGGGDGTYNKVANCLINTGVPMAILPLGTVSVLAKELSIPVEPDKAVDIALGANIRTVHLGRITLKQSAVSECFLLMAGIGFDGEVVCSVNDRLKKITGKGAYIAAALKTLVAYNPPHIKVSGDMTIIRTGMTDSGYMDLEGHAAIICKSSLYGGRFRVAPGASLTQPCFYGFVIHKKTGAAVLRTVLGVLSGRHPETAGITYFRAASLKVEGRAHVQIDGDYLGNTPATIEIVPDSLRLVVGKDY